MFLYSLSENSPTMQSRVIIPFFDHSLFFNERTLEFRPLGEK